jgi:engulfment/cell motility protein 1
MKFAVRSGLEDLPDRIEVAAISEIATGTCAAPPHVLRDQNDLPPTFPPTASPLSFSLLSAHEGSLADQIAPDQSRWADWTDGLNMLRRDGGHVSSKETAGFVQALTEIGLKIKLLGQSIYTSIFFCKTNVSVQICLVKWWRSPVDWSPDHRHPIPTFSFQN